MTGSTGSGPTTPEIAKSAPAFAGTKPIEHPHSERERGVTGNSPLLERLNQNEQQHRDR